MSPFRHPLITDESIHPRVVAYLRSRGFDVVDVKEQGWRGMSDEEILSRAHDEGRVVISHDRDFGTLAVVAGRPFTGILYLRPADIQAERTIEKLSQFPDAELTLRPPFISLAEITVCAARSCAGTAGYASI